MSAINNPSPERFPPPRQEQHGGLSCIVVDGGTTPTVPVVLCHGYGAPGHDLAGLAMEWFGILGEASRFFRCVFPAAPLSLADQGMPSGRAWWPLNMARLLDMAGASRFDELHGEEPPGLDEARDKLVACVRSILSSNAGPGAGDAPTWVFGGFSQGAMLSMDTVLRSDVPPPAVLLQLSGTLICREVWRENLGRLKQTTVIQSHGTADPILPFASAKKLRELLDAAGVDVNFQGFDGPHTIAPQTIELVAQTLTRLVPRQIGSDG